MSDTHLQAWAGARRLKHASLGGAVISLVATSSVASLIEARNSALGGRMALGVALLFPAILLVGFQSCPRCKKQWNSRGVFGYHTPYSGHCLNCGLAAPDAGPAPVRLLLGLLLGPTLVGLTLLLGLHFFAPRPTIHTMHVAAIESLRGTGDYVSFTDGQIRPELLGSHIHGKNVALHMVPLVPDDWTIAQPVHVWVICGTGPGIASCLDPAPWIALLESTAQRGASLEVARITHADVSRERSGWYSATRDASRKHGVKTDPRAMVVSWPSDPSDD